MPRRIRAGRAGWLGAALAVAWLGACRADSRCAVERVLVAQTPALQGLEQTGIGAADLAGVAGRLLDAAPGFVQASRAKGDARRFVAQVSVHRAEVRAGAGGAGPSAHVVLTVSLESIDGQPALREIGRGSAPIGAGAEALRGALERAARFALEGAVSSFSAQLAAEHKKTPELVRDLGSPDAGIREHAIRVLGARGDRDAVPALVARLQDSDPAVRERAVGALAQLRDPRAVNPLIALVHRRDAQYVAQMARIIGDIGGPDAEAWLLTMAWGHPDEVVRSAAHEALADMNARELPAHAQR